MPGINKEILHSVVRLRMVFVDDALNVKNVGATGFWLQTNQGNKIIVTNRHNLDAKLKLGSATTFELKKFEVELREHRDTQYFPGRNYFEVDLSDNPVRFMDLDDCAIIANPQFDQTTDGYGYTLFREEDIADSDFFKDKLQVMDTVSFFGYPENWYDQKWVFPTSRTAFIASLPLLDFTHVDVITGRTCLVSGMSFGGNSGSPIMSHRKSFAPPDGKENAEYAPAKLIGIMSGHWWDEAPVNGMFAHSGLSYFTKSTALLNLIRRLGL